MTKSSGRTVLAVTGLLMAMTARAGMGWACVPQPLVVVHPRSSAPAGSDVTVEAISVSGEAEVRWNGIDGPKLASASGPKVSMAVRIPDVSEGLYTLVVIDRGPDGRLLASGSAAFHVTPVNAAPTTTTLPARASEASSNEGVTVVLVLGGAALVIIGALAGAILAQRRPGSSVPSAPMEPAARRPPS